MDNELVDASSRLTAIERELGQLEVHCKVVESMNERAEFLTEQIVNVLEGHPVQNEQVPYFVTTYLKPKA